MLINLEITPESSLACQLEGFQLPYIWAQIHFTFKILAQCHGQNSFAGNACHNRASPILVKLSCLSFAYK